MQPYRIKLCVILAFLGLACLPRAADAAAPNPTIVDWHAFEASRPAADFPEPLISTREADSLSVQRLAAAVSQYLSARTDDFSALETYVRNEPNSPWRLAVEINLGLFYSHDGETKLAKSAFEAAWEAGRDSERPRARALADRAVGELLRTQIRSGDFASARKLLALMQARGVSGSAIELMDSAKETLWLVDHDPARAMHCGPSALKILMQSLRFPQQNLSFLDETEASPAGVSLQQLEQLAHRTGLDAKATFRAAGTPVPIPSIVHMRNQHFATILARVGDKYEIADPTSGEAHLMVSQRVLDRESTGYFLIPSKAHSLVSLREVPAAEASFVFGAMPTQTQLPSATRAVDAKVGGACGGHGLCTYDFTEMAVSVNLNDTPVGYQPPRGPAVPFTISYNQREMSQPTVQPYSNLGADWSFNWQVRIEDDPTTPGVSVTRYPGGGGSVAFAASSFNASTGAFAPESWDRSVLTLVSTSPVVYQRVLPDGTTEMYTHSDGSTKAPRRIFLTKLIDPQGNTISLNYDASLRLTEITDAIGQVTTLGYNNASFPLQVTRVTDPFGRAAEINYDSSGRLTMITDVIGMQSQFSYDSNSLVDALTTPYGTTTFTYGSDGNERYATAADPLGQTERLEWLQGVSQIPSSDPANLLPTGIPNLYNALLQNRNTYYWDKHAYPLASTSYPSAHIKHWCEQPDGYYTSTYIDSTKEPFENRVWRAYVGQNSTLESGTFNKPIAYARVLDNGLTQLAQITYNAVGNASSLTDPAGRTTILQYAPNGMDVSAVQQATSSGPATVAALTYNGQHEPLTYTDAAGQTTNYSYNTAGQIQSMTDALGETTRFAYNTLGYLTGLINANGKTATSFTYDNFGRVATRTDSEGWTVAYTYDALDRVTQETYPDHTTTVYTYKYLDLYSVKDRQNRTTIYNHDAVRNLTSITDPLKNVTKFGYYENGALKTLTDPNGNVTTWSIDVQGRVTGKTYADGTTVANAYENTTSRLHAVTDALGQTKQFSYGLDDQLTGIAYLNAVNATPSVAFTYDPHFTRLTSMTDGSGTTAYGYGAVGALGALKLAIEAPPFANAAIGYTYDALGRVIARSVGGDIETVTYDAIGRVTTHVDDIGAFRRSYLGQTGQLTRQTNGFLGTRWLYDTNHNDRRLTNIINSPVASAFSYTTTPEYDISAINEVFGGDSWKYAYDAADRLTGAASSLGNNYVYGYDFAGNLNKIQTSSGTTTITPNALNQVASSGGTAFTYDANGNLLQDYARTYAWDADNRLLAIGYLNQPGQVTRFKYDGLGRRIAIDETNSLGTSETRYGWCGEALCQARTATDSVIRRYVAEGEGVVGTGALYYSTDQLGSVRDVIVANNGLRAEHYDYAPYGAPTTSVGSLHIWTDFRYSGLFYHQPSGLYLATHRASDPEIGRWASRDPIMEGGGINLYAYVDNNPLNEVDSQGLDPEQSGAAYAAMKGISFLFIPGVTYANEKMTSGAWGPAWQAWANALSNRPTGDVLAGTPQEDARNAEHYAFAYAWTDTFGVAGYISMNDMVVGYSALKWPFYKLGLIGSEPTWNEVGSGLSGSANALYNSRTYKLIQELYIRVIGGRKCCAPLACK